jgi:di/tricarboxylate transporter
VSWEAWLTLGVIAAVVCVLVLDLLAPAHTILGAVIVLLCAGVVTPAQAFEGFSNAAPLTVAALYVLAAAVEKTGALQPVVTAVLGSGLRRRAGLARLLAPTAVASAFLNNTPIVVMLAPQVSAWARRHGVSASRYLMPISFATILGGVVTLIGTSTNLVVSGLLESAGYEPFGMFEFTPVGLPIMLTGVAFLVLFSPVLLPERRPAVSQAQQEVRQFVMNLQVVAGGPLDGQTVAAASLRNLHGVFLVEIGRGGEVIGPVAPHMVLRGGDRLSFVGSVGEVLDLQRTRGLVSAEQDHLLSFDEGDRTFFEAVIGEASPLVGQTLKGGEFRRRYQAAVMAIHRAGQRVQGKLGEVRLRVGDTLLLLADGGFRDRWRERSDFLLVARLGGAPPVATRKALWVGVIGVAIVVVAGLGLLPILHTALLGAMALVALRVLSGREARGAIDLDVVLVVAAAFGLGNAIAASGLAAALGALVVAAFDPLGPFGALLGIVLATVLLTELITNNAAAALIFPIAVSTAVSVGADPRAFALAVAIAASASFLTPIGYQTNTIVYGPGGYRFGDYLRLGFPLTVVMVATLLAIVGSRLW